MHGLCKLALIAGGALLLVSCGKPAEEKPAEQAVDAEMPAPEAELPAAGGEEAFAACRACHTIDKGGPNGVGPNLWGVVGRPVASVSGFTYSDAMKAKGGLWDTAALDTYLTSPMKVVPGTKMTFPGIADTVRRKELIDWLATQKD